MEKFGLEKDSKFDAELRRLAIDFKMDYVSKSATAIGITDIKRGWAEWKGKNSKEA